MRRISILGALLISSVQLLPAQGRPDSLYRGPYLLSREADFVEPESGAPMTFWNSTLQQTWILTTNARLKTLHSVTPAHVKLRTAFGPTELGMISFRMVFREPELNPSMRIVPQRPDGLLQFEIAPQELKPGPLALKPHMKVVFTVERVEQDSGTLLFENPDATELLWKALGRPSPKPQ